MSDVSKVGREIVDDLRALIHKLETVFGNSEPAFAEASQHLRRAHVALGKHPDLKGATITDPGTAVNDPIPAPAKAPEAATAGAGASDQKTGTDQTATGADGSTGGNEGGPAPAAA